MCVYHLLSPALLAVTARLAAHRLPPVAMCAPPETLFDGAASLPIGEALQRLGMGCSVAAVYTIEDEAGEVLYVGTSRNVAVSLRAHREAMPDRVSAVRLQDFSSPARREMEEVKRAWIRSLGRTPEGNDGRAQEWADALRSAVFAPISSARPRASAAMGSATGEPEQSAVESSSPGERASPFEAAASGAAASSAAASGLELTAAAVDSVLNEARPSPPLLGCGQSAHTRARNHEQVRPYLVADGGNVAVVSVDAATRNVYLRLEGACGSCPSSTVTMKMGIERVLREKFGSLGAHTPAAPPCRPLLAAIAALTAETRTARRRRSRRQT